ncbi:MAG: hypothetical protein U9R79_09300 [Armatimonadota bacterium]|nr:hypothetical protein [Armatimonadota bacterium]
MQTQQPTRLYTVFFTPGWGWGGSVPPKTLVSNEQILETLKTRCPGVEFIVRDRAEAGTSPDSIANELETLEDSVDGVLAFGGVRGDNRVALTGLPTIVVSNLFEFNAIPYEVYQDQGNVVTAAISRLNVVPEPQARALLDDLVGKIRLIQVLRKMRESTILAVTDRRLRYYPGGDGAAPASPAEVQAQNEAYQERLRETLGVESIIVGSQELHEHIQAVTDAAAREVAKVWIDEAQGWRNTTEEDVLDGARMYIGLDRLSEEYQATAIITDTQSFLETFEICACLPSMEYHKRGIVCTDQPNTGPALAQMFGLFLTGRPSFNADMIIDASSGTTVLVHCGAPVNPHGNDRVPYLLRDYRMGADVLAELPGGEPVTIWRINVMDKLILAHTGEAVSAESAYEGPVGLNDILCGMKLVAKVDAPTIQRHLNPTQYGVHRAAIYGDYREQVRDLAKLTGFRLIEEDR